MVQKVKRAEKGVYIERNVAPIFNEGSSERYTNYWMVLQNYRGDDWGVIGIQVEMSVYDRLIPESVIEEPYTLSFI